MNVDRSPAQNRLIVIEGVDGSGKSLQAKRLHQALIDAGHAAILTREPGGSAAAEDIRRLLVEGDPQKWDSMTELLLMYAVRRSHLRDTIWPALDAGQWVVSDRFADSSSIACGNSSRCLRSSIRANGSVCQGR